MIRKLAEEATLYCIENYKNVPHPTPWVWEETFAKNIIEHCAKIVEDASVARIPASEYGDLIRQFKRI